VTQDPSFGLFGDPPRAEGDAPAPTSRPSPDAPLAERMRPARLGEVVGQDHLLGPEGALRRLLGAAHLPSLILHGPPGSGKTTLARLLAAEVGARFVTMSAVAEGVPRMRELMDGARKMRQAGRRTLLFVDEIHRLSKSQQDFLLPFVESGVVTLVGATTEHPGFEVIPALLSRAQVMVLRPLDDTSMREVVRRALADAERGLGSDGLMLDPDAEELLVTHAGGDARRALGALEAAARLAEGGSIGREAVAAAMQRRTAAHDTTRTYELLSAFHKSLRASHPDAALYWAMRLVKGGEDPLVVFRRLVAAAYEDVGLADPHAGVVATQAMQAFERLGLPEGLLPLANAVLYVAQAPKSNRAYLALAAAGEAAERDPDLPVPLALRNAPTSLMKEWGYGEGYRYAHHYQGGYVKLECLPEQLRGESYYQPTDRGFEGEVTIRLDERRGEDG